MYMTRDNRRNVYHYDDILFGITHCDRCNCEIKDEPEITTTLYCAYCLDNMRTIEDEEKLLAKQIRLWKIFIKPKLSTSELYRRGYMVK